MLTSQVYPLKAAEHNFFLNMSKNKTTFLYLGTDSLILLLAAYTHICPIQCQKIPPCAKLLTH